MFSKPIVYFGSVRTSAPTPEQSIVGKFDLIVEQLGIKNAVKDKNVVIKVHLGLNVGISTIHPFLIGRLASVVKAGGGKPFLVDVMEQYPDAVKRGYTPEVLGCPLMPAAGPYRSILRRNRCQLQRLEEPEDGRARQGCGRSDRHSSR